MLSDYRMREPRQEDAVAVHDLIGRCEPLDENSLYCNLLQCRHFAETCVVAENDGGVVGFVSGYIPPRTSNTIFVWQVAVDETARGTGLGKKMLMELLSRPACRSVNWLHTTITEDNAASWGLFSSLARDLSARIVKKEFFDRDQDFQGRHDSEFLAEIGPFRTYFI
ncbi:diaminobutyrate acetyltransferase [Luteithermobacter gelatinilyticus]|uniref:diaminobutyrate acetyltransferase n=1 Tax=Luteithermobacter gelatinilyticus TaxID=2582913 RepID=UPI00110590FD|nr:diaminobutyrate acetyltransferase [Luteithermobacter gelatinilyticus]|tara:strand:- start:1555 stop:2055 length:501 start_codon:yes stop_codon:yes gene_type:complete